MQTPTSTRARAGGYSDFFSSGFRAISAKRVKPRPRPASTYSLPSIPSDLIRSMSSTSRRRSTDSQNTGLPYPLPSPKRKEDLHSNIVTPLPNEKRKKRSSFIEFSARLFDKMTPGVPEAVSFVEFDETRRCSRSQSRNGASHYSKLGIPSPIVEMNVSSIRTFYPDSNESDPFNSSPNSKSFFIDLSDSSSSSSFTSSPKRSRHQSFMSFSGSSLSSLTSFTRRERPSSIHSLPTVDLLSSGPVRTRYSISRTPSYHHPSNSDKASFSFQEESTVPESPYENDDRDLANIDWRDFHMQFFDNLPAPASALAHTICSLH
ncbi:hypothetical protein EV359DRAFT_86040 [Lentinula novae-zelandiae]|nr:hypothetical protein EV359DRAFT_86040 [Lentinula novae-zelandiae]